LITLYRVFPSLISEPLEETSSHVDLRQSGFWSVAAALEQVSTIQTLRLSPAKMLRTSTLALPEFLVPLPMLLSCYLSILRGSAEAGMPKMLLQ